MAISGSIPTPQSGMSGGAVMNSQWQLVGIHTGAERADQISESSGNWHQPGSTDCLLQPVFNRCCGRSLFYAGNHG
jgi:hypothetical protein